MLVRKKEERGERRKYNLKLDIYDH